MALNMFIVEQSFTLLRVQSGLPCLPAFLDTPQPLRVQGLSSSSQFCPLGTPKPRLPVDGFLSGFSFNFHGEKIVTSGTVASPQQLPHPLGPLPGQTYAPVLTLLVQLPSLMSSPAPIRKPGDTEENHSAKQS